MTPFTEKNDDLADLAYAARGPASVAAPAIAKNFRRENIRRSDNAGRQFVLITGHALAFLAQVASD